MECVEHVYNVYKCTLNFFNRSFSQLKVSSEGRSHWWTLQYIGIVCWAAHKTLRSACFFCKNIILILIVAELSFPTGCRDDRGHWGSALVLGARPSVEAEAAAAGWAQTRGCPVPTPTRVRLLNMGKYTYRKYFYFLNTNLIKSPKYATIQYSRLRQSHKVWSEF